jgi:putative peptidoglycan lipid II flippase
MLALSIPLTTLMLALTVPGIRLVFERGRFDASDAALLGATLAVYALSLVGSGVQRALLAPFYANLDTKMPLRNTIYGVGANIVLLPAFVLPLRGEERGVLALAAAYGVSQYVHVAHAAYRLRRDLGIPLRPLRRAALRSTVAGVLGGGVAAGVAAVTGIYDDVPTPHLLAGLMAAGTAGLAVVLLAERRGGGALSQLRKLRRSAPSGANDATDRKQAEPSLAERSS